jgi:hypothetical protein
MNEWTKLPPLKGGIMGCANCGYKPSIAEMERRIAVGFGAATLSKDSEIVWSEDNKEWEDCMTVAEAEEMAAADPDHDWRIHLFAPLSEVEYQRQDVGQWVLVKKGMGFA